MDKTKVKDFFNKYAPSWDADMQKDDRIMNTILDNANINETDVINLLDVACGTGVMIPYYLGRNISFIDGIDLSDKMIEIAEQKFKDNINVNFICDDVETHQFNKAYDRIVVYNAFPHFPNPTSLVESLSKLLTKGGILTIAHGMSKERINKHHEGAAHEVSIGLLDMDIMERVVSKYLKVIKTIDNDQMYQIVAIKE